MSEEFLDKNDELKRASEEISALRKELKLALGTLSRIERRFKVFFPEYVKKSDSRKKLKIAPSSNLNSEQLNKIFQSLVESTLIKGDEGFDQSIESIPSENILSLAIELGVSSISKINLLKAKTGIRGRVQEAIQLQFKPKYLIPKDHTTTDSVHDNTDIKEYQ